MPRATKTSRTRQTRKGALASGNCSPSRHVELPEGFGDDPMSRELKRRADAFDRLTGTEAEVCVDIQSRQERGLKKYGVSVAKNPLKLKAWLQHAYEETLDKAIYLKRAIREMENVSSSPTAGGGNGGAQKKDPNENKL